MMLLEAPGGDEWTISSHRTALLREQKLYSTTATVEREARARARI